MRLFEIDHKELKRQNAERLYDLIQENCQQYISNYPNWVSKPLYRGEQRQDNGFWYSTREIRKERKPTDSSQLFQDLIVQIYKDLGIEARRDNSIFCSFKKADANHYGWEFVIIPYDGYQSSTLTKIKDLYTSSITLFVNGLISFKDVDQPFYYKTSVELDISDSKYKSLPKLISYNQIHKYKPKHMNEKEFRSIFASKYDIDRFHEYINLLGIVDTGLSEYIKSHAIVNNLNISGNTEILITGDKYLSINTAYWPEFKRFLKTKG